MHTESVHFQKQYKLYLNKILNYIEIMSTMATLELVFTLYEGSMNVMQKT